MVTNNCNGVESGDNFIDELNEETLHLLKSEANRKRLQQALDEFNSGQSYSHELIEE